MDADTLGGEPLRTRHDVTMLLPPSGGDLDEILNPWETALGTEFAWLLENRPRKRTLRCGCR